MKNVPQRTNSTVTCGHETREAREKSVRGMPEQSRPEPSVLPQMQGGRNEDMEKNSPAQCRAEASGQCQKLCEGVPQTGQIAEGAMPELRGHKIPDVSPRLQQASTGDLALPSMSSQAPSGGSLYQVRDWTPADHAAVTMWRKAHLTQELPERMVPPLAVIAESDGEPIAFACCYFCEPREGGIPLAFVECVTTRPGLSLKQAREATGHCIECLKAMIAAAGGALMMAYGTAAASREAARLGFSNDPQPVMMNFMIQGGSTP